MYKLEDRILFDGAAIVDAAAAQQAQEAQEAEAQQQAEQQNPDQQDNNNIHETSTNPAETQNNQTTEDSSDSESPIDQLLAEALNLGGIDSDLPVNVLVISSSLENADALFDAADSDTIVLTYDAKTTSAAQLLQQISEALDGKKADSIGFVSESAEDAHLHLFADSDTTLDSLNDDVQQQFWNGLENFLNSDGHVDLFASNLASTETGQELVDAISETIDHEVSASTDLTGDVDAGGNWNLEYSTSETNENIDLSDVYFDQDSIDNFDALLEDHVNNEVAFINSSVMENDSIITELESRGIEIVEITDDHGFDQVSDYLVNHTDIDAVHIITHGNDGHFILGAETIDANFIAEHSEQLQDWGASLTENADIHIYGCNLTASDAGQAMVNSLASLTGADIAASDDSTGANGNWTLEHHTGTIDTDSITVDSYIYSLTNYAVTDLGDNGSAGQFRTILEHVSDGDSISFSAILPDHGDTITLSQGEVEINNLNITINGMLGNGENVNIDAQNESRHFYVNPDASVNLSNINLLNGHAGSGNDGGSVYVASNASASFNNISFNNAVDGSASTDGVAIYNEGTINLENVTISGYNTVDTSETHQVVFINSSVLNSEEIVNDLDENTEIVYLQNGLQEITDYLNSHSGTKYDAIHIFTHGNEGYFVLNGQIIDSSTVDSQSESFASWNSALADGADILIYGCNLAKSQAGQDLVANIAAITGADVAASNDSVGGLDWSLGYQKGQIDSGPYSIVGYDYHLADQIVKTDADSGDGSLRQAVEDVGIGESITFDNSYTINLSTSLVIDKSLSIDGGSNSISITGSSIDIGSTGVFISNIAASTLNLTSGTLYMADSNVTTFNNTGGTVVTDYDSGNHWGMLNTIGVQTGDSIFLSGLNNSNATTASISTFYGDNIGSNSNFYITTNSDVVDLTDNLFTLREAIIFSNSASHISFKPDVMSITLTNGDLAISKFIQIDGGDGLTIDANNSGRAIVLDNSLASAALTLNNAIITGARSDGDGGGLANYGGKILLENVNFIDNTAAGNGGAIFNTGDIQATNLNIDGSSDTNGSSAQNGAGIYLDTGSTLYVQNAAIFNSRATGNGGAIYSTGASITGSNLTLANNSATSGSAIYSVQTDDPATVSNIYLENATIGLNTGGVAVFKDANSIVTFKDSIITENTGGNTSGVISYEGTNYIDGESGTSVFSDTSPSDHGGWTYTLALNLGNFDVFSGIIDQGASNGETIYDQRGYMRNSNRDLGAYEANAYVAWNDSRDLYYTTIQAAIDEALAGDQISIVGSRIIVDTAITVDRDLILLGGNDTETVLDANHGNRIMFISNGPDTAISVRIDSINFLSGNAGTENGGAIYNNGESVILKNVTITDSIAVDGAAVYSNGGYIVLERSNLHNNLALNDGGAIYSNVGGVRLVETTIEENQAGNSGGAIFMKDDGNRLASLTLISSTINNNTAATMGGGVYAEGKVDFTNSTFAYNTANTGGGIYLNGNGIWDLTNITAAYNTSTNSITTTNNAAVYIASGELFANNALITYNTLGTGGFSDFYSSDTSNVHFSITNSSTADIFDSPQLKDNGGWTKTLALGKDSIAINAGIDKGVPGYDQRGYDSNGYRDIGAHEYNGIVAYYYNPKLDGDNKWVGTSTISSALSKLKDFDDDAVLNVQLVNTRILESNISTPLWKDAKSGTSLINISRTVNLFGHQEGGTVISAGYNGHVLTVTGTHYTNSSGSEVYVMGTLNLQRVTLSDGLSANNGGAIVTAVASTGGVINISESSLVNNATLGNGGAIYNRGKRDDQQDASFNLTESLVADNLAFGSGGGAYISKALNATSTTFANNNAFENGGGIAMEKSDSSAAVNLQNSTVSFNIASGHGGGVYNGGALTSTSTIYAKNRSFETSASSDKWGNPTYGYDYYVAQDGSGKALGSLSNGGYNLVESQNGQWVKDPSIPYYFGPLNDKGEISNGDVLGYKVNLFATDRLADNGGWSESIALSQTSAALNAGSGSTNDQRGFGINRQRDIGAFELNGIVAEVGGQKYFTIKEAVAVAGNGSTVNLYGTRIREHDILISKDITITTKDSPGNWYDLAMIDADNFGRAFTIKGNTVNATLNKMIITDGTILLGSGSGDQQAAGNGGAIFSAGTLTLTDVSISESFAQLSGGAIYSVRSLSANVSGQLEFAGGINLYDGAYFNRNMADLKGGAVYTSGEMQFSGHDRNSKLQFKYNYSNDGGAIYGDNVQDLTGGRAIKYAFFDGNSALKRGGALYLLADGTINISASTFHQNSSMEIGGAMYIETSNDVIVYNSHFLDNYTIGNLDSEEGMGGGGAIFFDGLKSASNLTIYTDDTKYDSHFTQNQVLRGSGGAIYMKDAGNLDIYSTVMGASVIFDYSTGGNSASLDGGAIYFVNSNNLTLGREGATSNGVGFYDNDAGRNGGAIFIKNSGNFSAYLNIDFERNYAQDNGGAVYIIDSGDVTMSQNINFNLNGYYISDTLYITPYGGAVYLENVGDISLDYVEAAGNLSYFNGGAMYFKDSGNVTIHNYDSYNNRTWAGNGASIYIENGSNEDRTVTITSSSFDTDRSGTRGAVYVDHASQMSLTNVTFANNTRTALYLGYGSLSLNYATFAYNSSGGWAPGENDAISIYLAGQDGKESSFSIKNSIIHDQDDNGNAPIRLGDTVTVTNSSHNVFSDYAHFAAALATGSYSTITAYRPYDVTASGDSYSVLDSNFNIVGHEAEALTFINNNLYLDTNMFYHANYLTRALALQSRNSIAYRYESGGYEVRAGEADSTVKYDQRDNMRSGIEVVDTNGVITYVYYEYGTMMLENELGVVVPTDTWIKVTVAEDGKATPKKASADEVNVSIGAFEPNFYMTVTSNADHASNDDRTLNVPEWTSIDNALANGVTLREGMFWIDTYDITALANSNDVLFDANRYVKFADSMFADPDGGSNVIILGEADDIMLRTDVTIGMINQYLGKSYTDTNGDTHYFEADNSFLAQDNASRITIDAGGKSRIFHIETRSDNIGRWTFDSTFGMNNITIKNGMGLAEEPTFDNMNTFDSSGRGGAIFLGDSGIAYINNSVIKDSTARNTGTPIWDSGSNLGQGGGIFIDSGARLYMYDSTVTNNYAIGTGGEEPQNAGLGGGIYNAGTTVIERSLINNNHVVAVINKDTAAGNNSGTGGGVFSNGNITINSSTISGNYNASSEVADGAAITIWSGRATLEGNTIAYNKAYNGSPLNLTRDSYAVYLHGNTPITLRNNIIAQNYISGDVAQNRRDIRVDNSVILIEFNNIIGSYDKTGYDFGRTAIAHSDILGFNSSGYVEDLNLSTELLYNGGKTQNYRVLTGSTAIGHADYSDSGLDFDQRNLTANGTTQLRNTIGAYELLTYVTVDSDVADKARPATGIAYDFAQDQGGWTSNLRNALYLSDQGGSVIINVITGSETYTLTNGQLEILNGISVTTDGAVLTIDGQNNSRIFAITDPSTQVQFTVSLSNFKLINGNADASSFNGYGGAIYSTEGLSLDNVTIEDTNAAGHGGAIYVLSGGLTLDTVSIDNATSGGHGGAVFLQTDSFNATDVSITNSTAAGHGGAIYLQDGDNFVLDTSVATKQNTISDNTAGGSGGGIYFGGNDMTVTRTVIRGNTAANDSDGGGIFVNAKGTVTIDSSTVGENYAGRGGGVFVYSGSVLMTNATIANNQAYKHGGGIYLGGNALGLTYTTVANNIAGYNNDDGITYQGGGIYLERGSLNMTNTIAAQNYTNSIDSANRNDLYFGAAASVGTVQYSIIGTTNRTIANNNNIYMGDGVGETRWSELKLDTKLSDDLGGSNPMPMVYVFNGSIAVGNGVFDPSITVDQRGITRHNGVKPDGPTIGAYEKRFLYYYFEGDISSDASDINNWASEDGSTVTSAMFDTVDAVLLFDHRALLNATVSTEFSIGDKTSIEFRTGGLLTVEAGGTLTALTMAVTGGTFTVNGQVSGTLDVQSGLLNLNTQDQQIANLTVTISDITNSSTVAYNYSGTQTVRVLSYGNLSISGGNTKSTSSTITVNGNLNIIEDSTLSVGSLTVEGNTLADSPQGTILSAGDINLNGDVGLSGSSFFGSIQSTGGNINLGTNSARIDAYLDSSSDLTALNGNITVYADATADIVGTINAGGTVAVSTANGGSITIGSISTNGDVELGYDGANLANTVEIRNALNADNVTIKAISQIDLSSASSVTSSTINGTLNIETAGNVSISSDNLTAGNIQIGTALTSAAQLNLTDAVINTGSGSFDLYATDAFMNSSTVTSNTVTINSALHLEGTTVTGTVVNLNGNVTTIDNVIGASSTVKGSLSLNPTSSVIVYAGDSLTFDVVSTDILLDDGTSGYNVNNMDVSTSGTLEFRTTGDIYTNVDAAPSDLKGTLTLTGTNIDLSAGADFADTNWLILNNSGLLTLGNNVEAKNLSINGNISLEDNTIISVGNTIEFNGTISGGGYSLTVNANGGITINDASNLNDLNLTAGTQITLNGTITAAGNANFNNAVIISGANTSVTGSTITFADTVGGTGNLTVAATSSGTFSDTVNIGNMTITSGAFTANGTMTTADLTINAGSLTSNALLTTSNLTLNTGGSLTANADVSTANLTNAAGATVILGADLTMTGNLTNAGSMTAGGEIALAGSTRQVLSLTGTSNFDNATVVLSNTTGAELAQNSNLSISKFKFDQADAATGKFYIGDNTLEIQSKDSDKTSGANWNHYFVINPAGRLSQWVTSGGTEYWLGNEASASVLKLTGSVDEKVSVGTYGTINDDGTTAGYIILGIDNTVKRTWNIEKSSSNQLTAQFTWSSSEEGSGLGSNVNLYTRVITGWQVAGGPDAVSAATPHSVSFAITANGPYVVAAPGTDFDSEYTFKGLNNNQQQLGQPQDFNLPVNVPESEGKAAYDVMQFRLNNSSLTNPLDGMVPRVGRQMALNLSLESNFEFAYGFSVYGTSDGEYALNAGEEYEEELDSDYYIIEEEIAVDPDMEEMFVEMASRDTLMEKHAACKNDLDKILDDLIAS